MSRWRTPPASRGSLVEASRGESGFTLVEVVVAMVLLAIGLVGAAAAVSVQVSGGLTAAASTGLGAISRSTSISTATMLAQEMIEKLKADSTVVPTATSACSGTGYTAYGNVCTETTVANFSTYMRTTTVATNASLTSSTSCDPAGTTSTACATTVTVVVTYQASGDVGTSFGGTVTLASVIAKHP